MDRRIEESGQLEAKQPYSPTPNPLVQRLSKAHTALFNTWRKWDGRIGHQRKADKAGAAMSKLYKRIMDIA